jgi:hypothetical protein
MRSLTDFMNIKIKPDQSFKGVHRISVCAHVFIEVSAHIYIYEYVRLSSVI